jgi:signal recognition particle receptor subunit beta
MRTLFVAALLLMRSTAEAASSDDSTHEILAKVVYYGPWSASDRLRDNLQYISKKAVQSGAHDPKAEAADKSSPPSDGLRIRKDGWQVLNFDFLPMQLEKVRGRHVRFDLYAVVGHGDYEAIRRLTLKGADGVVFVADSDPAQKPATLDSWKELKQFLADQGRDYRKTPITVQLDHRDHPNAVPVAEMKRLLELTDQPVVEAVSSTGVGVFASLKSITKQVMTKLEMGARE